MPAMLDFAPSPVRRAYAYNVAHADSGEASQADLTALNVQYFVDKVGLTSPTSPAVCVAIGRLPWESRDSPLRWQHCLSDSSSTFRRLTA
jgi:hypothetical protein